MSYTKIAAKYPPVLCRLLARNGREAATTARIRALAGLSEYEVQSLSGATSWERVPFGMMQKFLAGCGIDFENCRQMSRINDFIKDQARQNSPWRHLRKSGEWLSYYEPLLKIYVRSLK